MTGRLIPSFARRQGRALPARAKRLVATLLPELRLDLPGEGMLDPAALWPQAEHVAMEIGFGGGEYLAELARLHPETGFIGCEPYLGGVARLLARIEANGLENIRLFTDDARRLCDRLPEGCIRTLFVLFPDPWPKTRHHKRRLISQATLDLFARIQPEGATLHLATDHRDYADWMLEALLLHPHYHWTARRAADWHRPPEGWVQTRYQRKTEAEGRGALFFEARRL